VTKFGFLFPVKGNAMLSYSLSDETVAVWTEDLHVVKLAWQATKTMHYCSRAVRGGAKSLRELAALRIVSNDSTIGNTAIKWQLGNLPATLQGSIKHTAYTTG